MKSIQSLSLLLSIGFAIAAPSQTCSRETRNADETSLLQTSSKIKKHDMLEERPIRDIIRDIKQEETDWAFNLKLKVTSKSGRFICSTILPVGLVLILCILLLRIRLEWRRARLPDFGNAYSHTHDHARLIGMGVQPAKVPPRSIWLAGPVFFFTCNVNLTIAMPLSKKIAEQSGWGVTESGIIIGAWAAGGILGFLAFWYTGCSRVRTCYFAHALLMMFGGIAEVLVVIFLSKGVALGVCYSVARSVQGLGCGVQYTVLLAITHASSSSNRPAYYAYTAAGGTLGISMGLVLSSATERILKAIGARSSDGAFLYAPGVVVCAFGLIAFTLVLALCPSDRDMQACTESEDEEMKGNGRLGSKGHRQKTRASSKDDSTQQANDAFASIGFAVLTASPLLRCMLRASWEAGALLLLRGQLSRLTSSAFTSLVVIISVIAQVLYGVIVQRWCTNNGGSAFDAIIYIEIAAVLGILLMLVPGGIATFICGSALLYSANSMIAAPVQSTCIGLTEGQTSWLSPETTLLAGQGVWVAGALFGPVYSRAAMAGSDVTHVTLVVILMPLLLFNILATEIGLRGVRKPAANVDAPSLHNECKLSAETSDS